MATRKPLVLGASGHPEQLQGGDTTEVTIASVEIDLGYPVRRAGTFSITGLAGLTAGKPVQIWLASGPYTGKGASAGEEGMYAGQITGVVANASKVNASFAFSSRIGGVIKFNYLIGA